MIQTTISANRIAIIEAHIAVTVIIVSVKKHQHRREKNDESKAEFHYENVPMGEATTSNTIEGVHELFPASDTAIICSS